METSAAKSQFRIYLIHVLSTGSGPAKVFEKRKVFGISKFEMHQVFLIDFRLFSV